MRRTRAALLGNTPQVSSRRPNSLEPSYCNTSSAIPPDGIYNSVNTVTRSSRSAWPNILWISERISQETFGWRRRFPPLVEGKIRIETGVFRNPREHLPETRAECDAHRLETDLRKPLFRSVTRADGGVGCLSGSRSKLLSPVFYRSRSDALHGGFSGLARSQVKSRARKGALENLVNVLRCIETEFAARPGN
jgi:hypothetical protein